MSTFYLGRYNCIEAMGSGPLGETFRAKIYGVAGFEKQFAVKRIHAELCADAAFIQRFVKAASAAAQLSHERIAAIHEVGAQGAIYYVAADLVRGLDLEQLTAGLKDRGEAITPDAAITLALDLLEGLAHAHGKKDLRPTGVLYLGLGPRSALISPEGDAKLTDVGLFPALVVPGWATDARVGRLAWTAPEVADGVAADARADVFSLGALLHLSLSGSAPFAGVTAAEVRQRQAAGPPPPPACEGRLQAAISRALAPDAAARFPSVEAFADELRPILSARAGRARGDLAMLVRRISSRIAPVQPQEPVLQDQPSKNTFAGVGPADDVPVQRADLPGPATEKAMDTVPPPATPAPATPAVVTPALATSTPATPAVVTPALATPTPVTPTPVTPALATPTPVTPAPLTPARIPPPLERPRAELLQPILPVLPRTEQVTSLPDLPPPSRRRWPMVVGAVVLALASGTLWLRFGAGESRTKPPANVVLPAASPTPLVTQRELPMTTPAPRASTLQVTTNPAGALLFIDGEARGQAPLQITLAPGSHKLVAVSEHAKIRKQEVHVDGSTELALTMEPAETTGPAGLKVRCKSKNELRIFVDGVDSGLSCPNETRINVTPGEHTVGLYSPRTDKTDEVQATVKEDENHSTRIRVNY